MKKLALLIPAWLLVAGRVLAAGGFGEDEVIGRATDLIPVQGSAAETIAVKAGTIIGTLTSFLGTIFLLLIIYAGFNWMTAAGNDKKVGDSKKLMVMAVIGLIIILSAYAITTFIADNILPQR